MKDKKPKIKNKELLAIDIGNTTLCVGIFRNDKLIFKDKIPTEKSTSKRYYADALAKIIGRKDIVSVIISSVVPEVTKVVKRVLLCKFELNSIILGEDRLVPIKNLYKNPRQVGQDRLVNAYAGYKKFGGGLIIVDFGTAVTFDVVTKKGEYMGGLIVPGLETSLNLLFEKAALLPRIKLAAPAALIGRDTVTSIRSGVLNGYGAMCDGVVGRINKELKSRFKVILTGGHARLISKFCRFHKVQPELTLEGLRLISRKLW